MISLGGMTDLNKSEDETRKEQESYDFKQLYHKFSVLIFLPISTVHNSDSSNLY